MHNRRFMEESQITTNIAHLSLGRLKSVEFPIPPLDEQRQRAREARSRLEVASRLRAGLTSANRRAIQLRRSILAAAFSGQLVPQDPSDEPATELLERIRAEKPGKNRWSTRKVSS
jgi:type I restriction enzyme S subunit